MPNDPPQAGLYQAATTDAVLFERTDRASIEVTGDDRAAWLHNLVTNVVKTLQPGEGNYAFAVNVKGRVLFDLNVLVLEDRLLLDVDRRWLDAAMDHLNRYIITDDVTLKVLADAHRRIAIMGPKAHELVARLSLGNLAPMAQLQHCGARIAGADVRMIRHDFAGLPAAEFIVPSEQADAVHRALESNGGSPPWIDSDTVNILRIEAGIPAPGTQIVGVVAACAPTYALSVAAGEPVPTESSDTLADGLAVRTPDARALDIIRKGAERVVTVTEDEILAAMRYYFSDTHNIAEGAGAAALAGLLKERERMRGRKVGLILSGGNLDRDLYLKALDELRFSPSPG